MKKDDVLYQLHVDDLTGLGGPMGTERVTRHTVDAVFKSAGAAQIYAESHYNNSHGPIVWTRSSNGWFRSQDLGYVQYVIQPVVVK